MERAFAEFLELAPDAMLVADSQGAIRHANGRAAELFGYPPGALDGTPLSALLPSGHERAHAEHVQRFFEAPRRRGLGHARQLLGRKRDGSVFPVDIALSPVVLGDEPLAVAAIRDLGPRLALEAALRLDDERATTVMELARVGAWEVDLASDTRRYSPQLLALLQRDDAHGSSDAFFEAMHPDDRDAVAAATRSAVQGGDSYHIGMRIYRGDGALRWFETKAFVDRDAAGRPLRLRGLAMDVTERRQAEDELRRSEGRYRLVLETSPDTILVTNRAGVIDLASGEELDAPTTGQSIFDRLLPEATGPLGAAMDQALATGELVTVETAVAASGGGERWFRTRVRPIDDDHDAERLLVVSTDITDARLAEQRLADYRAAMENAVDGFARVDASGVIASTNVAYARMHGYAPDDLVGSSWLETFPHEEHARAVAARQMAGEHGRAELDAMALRRDGSLFPKRVTIVPVGASSGAASGTGPGHYCFTQDITEQQRARAQLVVADRMASIGMLAAGVGHEINNPLAVVLGQLDLAIETLTRGELAADPRVAKLTSGLREASDAAIRMRYIVRDLRMFARDEPTAALPVDVHQVLDASLRLAHHELAERARVERRFRRVPLVQGNDGRLGQVFLNLLVNAAQAIEPGAPLANTIQIATSLDPSGLVAVEVRDTGAGMSPEVRARLFDPFFTTKPVGVGTGLGLSICYGIVTELGGRIEVESAEGIGSAFRVLLPPHGGEPSSAGLGR